MARIIEVQEISATERAEYTLSFLDDRYDDLLRLREADALSEEQAEELGRLEMQAIRVSSTVH